VRLKELVRNLEAISQAQAGSDFLWTHVSGQVPRSLANSRSAFPWAIGVRLGWMVAEAVMTWLSEFEKGEAMLPD